MRAVVTIFGALARHGKIVLIAGLLLGIFVPGLADQVRSVLPELVALMLGVAALRIGPRAARGSFADMRTSLKLVVIFQVAMPLLMAGVFLAIGWSGALATGLILMGAAPSISGSPNITVMTGHDPAPALRLMIAGVALVPLTIIPVFLIWPVFGSPGTVAMASLRLLLLIGGATAVAFIIRQLFFPEPSSEIINVIDGASALLMAVLVIGLMSAVGPAITATPLVLAGTMGVAFLVNFGLQILAYRALAGTGQEGARVAWSIIAGNRNIALFLAALPAAVVDPLLLFIGCYQVPMYLTPLLLGRFYRPLPSVSA